MPDETIAVNRRARHEYAIEDTLEAGLVLTGTEIKSIRAHKVNIAEAYVRIDHGEAWLIGAHIAEYAQGNRYNHAPTRTRKLLLHRDQIAELLGLQSAKGLTIVPLRLYLRRGNAKLEIGIARGKKAHDKRRAIAERDMRRELDRETKAAGRIKL
ncbi:MAG TPA: SsrA-binding protein SmpB [Candidatus Limnocylindria bacterium]|jgi:SsrA-binding protein|nr:SsrA-binding protein SmpB [Candidatus Limnocylindria bacterium]